MSSVIDKPKTQASKQHRKYDPINPYAVLYYLHDLNYPASRESIVASANSNNAPVDVLQIVDNLVDKNYHNELELIRTIARIR